MKIKGEKKVKKILDLIADEMKSAFTACGYDASYAKVVLSNRPDLCEYQCNGATNKSQTSSSRLTSG